MKYILIAVLLLTSCGYSDAFLGDGYYYLSVEEAIDVGYPDGAIIYKSTERYFFKDVVITGDVIKVENNKSYIAAKQIDRITDSINYFLIDKISNINHGPFDLDSLRILIKKFDTNLEIKSNF